MESDRRFGQEPGMGLGTAGVFARELVLVSSAGTSVEPRRGEQAAAHLVTAAAKSTTQL